MELLTLKMLFPQRLDDNSAYQAWRARKLERYPTEVEGLRVRVENLAEPTPAEVTAICQRVAKCNLALVDCADPAQVSAAAVLRFGERIGLRRTDTHRCSDPNAVSHIRVEPHGRASELIPYTNRPLQWHTDGYYNSPQRPIRAWLLFCLQDAAKGGENALLDPEIAYLRLRDQAPGLIQALTAPDLLSIPANTEGGVTLREASVGPVFSWPAGQLHMRYTARARHAVWASRPEANAAREALVRLFSTEPSFIFRYTLKPGEGYVTNNVLHNRSGFEVPAGCGQGRQLLRVRYLDRIDDRVVA